MVRLDYERVRPFLQKGRLEGLREEAARAHRSLIEKTGPGSDFTGWRDMLVEPDDAVLEESSDIADEIRRDADVLVCIGIGGSFLGAKAVIQALTPYLHAGAADGPEILFAGHHMSGAYHRELLEYLRGKSVYLNVISKSGTTLEPALAFRLLRQYLESNFEDPERRIIVTTDESKGALNALHDELGYRKYVIPRDVGGRFSVLTPVGLVPIACAGVDIRSLFYGAVKECKRLTGDSNAALEYASARYALLEEGYSVDLLSVFEPKLRGLGEWWQQLFGESEGKKNTGLFPAVAQYSTDLHSLGQYVQEGQRSLIETFLIVENDGGNLAVPDAKGNLDGLNYLTGKTMTAINRAAYEGTAEAHTDGGVPNLTVWLDEVSPDTIGEAIYFFEHAVAVSGYLLGVNPFDQPGVEAYKRAMFSRLGKP